MAAWLQRSGNQRVVTAVHYGVAPWSKLISSCCDEDFTANNVCYIHVREKI